MIEIIFKNEDFVVFNKPNGVLTHPVNSNSEISVRNKLLEMEPSITEWGVEKREGIVHRLDKVTSGLIVAALNFETFTYLQSLFKERKVYKEYSCLVEGHLKTQSGVIELPLSKSKKNKTKRAVSNEGKISTSHFEVIDEYENCTKLKIQLITGRNHQIRSQMEYLGNPILNDVLYSAKKVESLNKDQICLMSKKLKFNHKSNNYEFEATEPDFFNALINV